jgi:hypothetical protein
MDEDAYITYLESNYGGGRAKAVTWKPARDSNSSPYLYDEENDNYPGNGFAFATFERRPRTTRIRPDLTLARTDQLSAYWDPVNDQPRYAKYSWGANSYQLPIVPPQSASTEKKQIVLQHTISSLKQAEVSYWDKYNALTNRFPIGKDLVPHVTQRTDIFQDPTSPAYLYNDVTVMDENMRTTALSNPITDAEKQTIRFVKATITS